MSAEKKVWVGMLLVGVIQVQGVTAAGSGTSVRRHEIVCSVIRKTILRESPSAHYRNSDFGDLPSRESNINRQHLPGTELLKDSSLQVQYPPWTVYSKDGASQGHCLSRTAHSKGNTSQGQYLSLQGQLLPMTEPLKDLRLKGSTFQGQYFSRTVVFRGSTLHG